MAKAVGGIESLSGPSALAPSLRSVRMLRLAIGYVVLLGSTISVIGTSWDIQWHSFVGRDRTLIPPHIMMLSGLTISGLAALAAVLIETAWTRRNPLLAKYNTGFADYFHSSFGSYIAGFAALNAAIAFPLDSYWHALYGIDVTVWAPFHVMLIVGGGVVILGAAYMLISAAQLTTHLGDAGSAENSRAARAEYIGAIIAFALMLSMFSYLLVEATDDQGFITFGAITFNLFPLFSGLLVAWTFVTVIYAIPWRRVATYVSLLYLLIGLIFEAFVPPATRWLVAQEHLTYRKDLGEFANLSIVAARFWSLTPIVAAILIDFFYRRAQREHWSDRKSTIILALAASPACLPLVALLPLLPVELIILLGVIGFPVSMLAGLLGTLTGTWFGRRVGQAMQQVERTA